MLDDQTHQGTGLQGLAGQVAPRVIALASHGNPQHEMALLWDLCASLVALGYPVALLDGGTAETSQSQGLLELLENDCWRPEAPNTGPVWTMMAAALGLHRLCNECDQPAHRLAPLRDSFQHYEAVVIYAKPRLLARLLKGSATEPLLALSAQAGSQLSAYQALKSLVLEAGLSPTIAAIMGARPNKLQECALNFLGYRAPAQTLADRPGSDKRSDAVAALALRLLERAVALPLHHLKGARHVHG